MTDSDLSLTTSCHLLVVPGEVRQLEARAPVLAALAVPGLGPLVIMPAPGQHA